MTNVIKENHAKPSGYVQPRNRHNTLQSIVKNRIELEAHLYMSSLLTLFQWEDEKDNENED